MTFAEITKLERAEADAIKQAEHILGVEITPSPDVGTTDIDNK